MKIEKNIEFPLFSVTSRHGEMLRVKKLKRGQCSVKTVEMIVLRMLGDNSMVGS